MDGESWITRLPIVASKDNPGAFDFRDFYFVLRFGDARVRDSSGNPAARHERGIAADSPARRQERNARELLSNFPNQNLREIRLEIIRAFHDLAVLAINRFAVLAEFTHVAALDFVEHLFDFMLQPMRDDRAA